MLRSGLLSIGVFTHSLLWTPRFRDGGLPCSLGFLAGLREAATLQFSRVCLVVSTGVMAPKLSTWWTWNQDSPSSIFWKKVLKSKFVLIWGWFWGAATAQYGDPRPSCTEHCPEGSQPAAVRVGGDRTREQGGQSPRGPSSKSGFPVAPQASGLWSRSYPSCLPGTSLLGHYRALAAGNQKLTQTHLNKKEIIWHKRSRSRKDDKLAEYCHVWWRPSQVSALQPGAQSFWSNSNCSSPCKMTLSVLPHKCRHRGVPRNSVTPGNPGFLLLGQLGWRVLTLWSAEHPVVKAWGPELGRSQLLWAWWPRGTGEAPSSVISELYREGERVSQMAVGTSRCSLHIRRLARPQKVLGSQRMKELIITSYFLASAPLPAPTLSSWGARSASSCWGPPTHGCQLLVTRR